MSYVLHFWDFPIPHTAAEADRFCSEAQARRRSQNPLFIQLATDLTARYPCLCDFEDDASEACVWVDGPLDGITDRGCYSLGIVTRHLEEVYPFVVETATSLGLVVYDFQCGDTFLPAGMVVRGDAVMIGDHFGLPLGGMLTPGLVERTLMDALRPILERLDFAPDRALGGLWLAADEIQQRLRFRLFEATPDMVSFDIEILVGLNPLKKVIEPLLAAATHGTERYVAAAISSLALFSIFYRMPSGLAKMTQDPLRFEVRSLDELRTLAIELRSLAVKYLCPALRKCEELGGIAYFLHSTKPDARRILGSRSQVEDGNISSAVIARNLFSAEGCGGHAVAVLIAAFGGLPMGLVQSIVDAAYEHIVCLPLDLARSEKAKLDLCLKLLRENGRYA